MRRGVKRRRVGRRAIRERMYTSCPDYALDTCIVNSQDTKTVAQPELPDYQWSRTWDKRAAEQSQRGVYALTFSWRD